MSTSPPPAREHAFGFRPTVGEEEHDDGQRWTVSLKHNHDHGILTVHDPDGVTLHESRLDMSVVCPVAHTAPADHGQLDDNDPMMFVVTAADGMPDVFTANAPEADHLARVRGGLVGALPLVADYRDKAPRIGPRLIPIRPSSAPVTVQIVQTEQLRIGDTILNHRNGVRDQIVLIRHHKDHHDLFLAGHSTPYDIPAGDHFMVLHPRPADPEPTPAIVGTFITPGPGPVDEPREEPEESPIGVALTQELVEQHAKELISTHGAEAGQIVRRVAPMFGQVGEMLIEAVDREMAFRNVRPPVPLVPGEAPPGHPAAPAGFRVGDPNRVPMGADLSGGRYED